MKLQTILCLVLMTIVLFGCNGREVGVSETPIKIVSDTKGRGRQAEDGRTVYIDYNIRLPNGDTVIKHNDWRFVIGNQSVVEGIEEAVIGMRVGGKRVVECPPHKHWGRNGHADVIPPNTWLTMDIKLNRVE